MWQECNQYIDQYHVTNISPNCTFNQNQQTLDEISPPSLVVFPHWPSPSSSVVLTPNKALVSRNLLEKPDEFSLRFPFPGGADFLLCLEESVWKGNPIVLFLLPSLGFDSEAFFLFAFMQPNETGQEDCCPPLQRKWEGWLGSLIRKTLIIENRWNEL